MSRSLFGLSVRLLCGALFLAVAILTLPLQAMAQVLTVDITNSPQSATVGQTVTFGGTITNDSGFGLDSTDFFFDFFGYDPNLTVNQLLGSPDFPIPNGATTSVVDLFSVNVGSGAATGNLPVQFQLEDVFGDVSQIGSVTVSNSPLAATPEPSTMCLVGGALMILFLLGLRRH
jgi:hypothetical protein